MDYAAELQKNLDILRKDKSMDAIDLLRVWAKHCKKQQICATCRLNGNPPMKQGCAVMIDKPELLVKEILKIRDGD